MVAIPTRMVENVLVLPVLAPLTALVLILCAGQVVHGASHFAAHLHSIPDEETGGSRAREGGGLGRGNICSALCDAMEQL